ncbi:hypothetical protein RAS1_37840 [Phycisphaerae bacterium RAS1]|nr:hypothetical protein RAS1_37840 [Phycisphaerae bacterium RAS1]
MKRRGPDFLLELRAEPAGVDVFGRDPVYRLRVALKRLLRNFGLRAVRVRTLRKQADKQEGADR